jgi:hypothetical protein
MIQTLLKNGAESIAIIPSAAKTAGCPAMSAERSSKSKIPRAVERSEVNPAPPITWRASFCPAAPTSVRANRGRSGRAPNQH